MNRFLLGVCGLWMAAGCRLDRPADGCETVVQVVGAADGEGVVTAAPGRTITVQGDAEMLTAPDRFVLTVGFDLQEETLDAARDGARERAADLLAVAGRHAIDARDVQTERLTLAPRFDGYGQPGGQRIVGYQASRDLTLIVRSIDDVEPLLHDMLAAGANRVDRVVFESSEQAAKRDEARLLAIAAARAKAESMASALEQRIGEPLRIEEIGAVPLWHTQTTNVVLGNDSAARVGDTVASGKLRIHAGVRVVFALHGA